MNEQDKKIRELLKGQFDAPVPSVDFTKNVMEQITSQEVVKEEAVFQYKPVISKWGWGMIAVSFFVIVYLGLTQTQTTSYHTAAADIDWSFDVSFFHSKYALFAVVSILALLIIDRFFIRFKVD